MTADITGGTGFTIKSDLWLSGIVGRPALRLVRTNEPSGHWSERLKAENLFVTAKLPAEEIAATGALESLGFRMVDAALTFEATQIVAPPAIGWVRFACAGDRDAVARIAGESFVYSRFHLDPLIPKALADKVKEAWAANFFEGKRGDGMVVAEQDGAVVGFLLLRWADNVLVIDLIAVVRQAARRGLARAMIAFAAAQGTDGRRRPAGFRVGTQAANVPSVRLYEGLGFRLTETQFVLHHHGRAGPYGTEASL